MKAITNVTAFLSAVAALASVVTGWFVHQRLPEVMQQIKQQNAEIVQLRSQLTMMTFSEFGGHSRFGGEGGGGGKSGGAGGGGGGGFGQPGGNGGSINYRKAAGSVKKPPKML